METKNSDIFPITDELKEVIEAHDKAVPYAPSKEEILEFAKILFPKSFENFSKRLIDEDYSFKKIDEDRFLVSTPRGYWMTLSGIEWCVNIKDRTYKIFVEN